MFFFFLNIVFYFIYFFVVVRIYGSFFQFLLYTILLVLVLHLFQCCRFHYYISLVLRLCVCVTVMAFLCCFVAIFMDFHWNTSIEYGGWLQMATTSESVHNHFLSFRVSGCMGVCLSVREKKNACEERHQIRRWQ